AQWENNPRQLFLTNAVSPESRPLGFEGMMLASVSSRGELALLSFPGTMNIAGGTLWRAPMNGGSPLELDRNIMSADFSPDGRQLAVVRAVKGSNQVEFPTGKVLYRTSGWVSHMRVSPKDGSVAFIDHPVRHEDAGSVKVVRPGGQVETLSDGWANAGGLAWHPDSNEVWFTAARRGAMRGLHAATLSARLRTVAQAPGMMSLRDISPEGRVLITRDSRRLEMAGSIRGAHEESFSWLDWSRVQEISSDGNLVLFDESGEGAGDRPVVYVQDLRTRSAARIGDGRAMAFTPAGDAVLILSPDRKTFRLHSLRGGEARTLPATGLEHQWARMFPGGKRILSLAAEPGKALRLYLIALDGASKPRPLSGEIMVRNVAIGPLEGRFAVLTAEGKLTLFDADGASRVLAEDEPLAPMGWSRDGRWLFVQHLRSYTELPARLSRLDLDSGRRLPWKQLSPADSMGVTGVTGVALAPAAGTYVYSYRRILAELFVVSGW
ncbi:MAG: WD40 repeat domain-containing protein, partial [Bryobacterales bacterium]|nr:WD40 repeat domain-containing protein [Bryobacterales bacterium]